MRTAITIACLLAFTASTAEARNFTGPRGGTASGTVTQKGNTVSGQGTATSANGQTVSGEGSVTYHPVSGTVDGQGSVTGPQGSTYSATGTAGNGSATVTGGNGKSKTWHRAQ